MFGFIPLQDPEASDDRRRFPPNLAMDVIAARRLTEIRERLGLSQSEVARAASALGLKWSRNTVHAIERFGLGGRVEEGEEHPDRPRATNPQSGTRRLTLMELLVVPKILDEACRTRGKVSEPIHPLWFLERETLVRMKQELLDPGAELRTWSDPAEVRRDPPGGSPIP